MEKDAVKTFHATSRAAWREWLVQNHAFEKNLRLIIYKKQSGIPSVTYDESVDEALCFGWIDSTRISWDEQSHAQFYSKRKPKSNWSRVNKAKVERLMAEGLMTSAGLEVIEWAKKTGTWTALDDVENLTIPDDLQAKLATNPTAKGYFDAFPRSAKRAILEWLLNAKQAETRLKRIEETVNLAEKNERANQYRPKVI
jgi:uncharacterized protein YdeI (YjbR/CyaY-like superfamily)